MQKRTQVIITFSVAILLIAGLYFFTDWFSKVTGFLIGEDDKTKLAQCLTGRNAELFGSDYCKECEEQKKLFGSSFKTIVYIDCGKTMKFVRVCEACLHGI